MSETTEVRCDACGAKLSEPGNDGWRYYLSTRSRPVPDGEFREVDPLPRGLDFCDLRCVAVWIAEPGRVS